jgi:hypothetical protein
MMVLLVVSTVLVITLPTMNKRCSIVVVSFSPSPTTKLSATQRNDDWFARKNTAIRRRSSRRWQQFQCAKNDNDIDNDIDIGDGDTIAIDCTDGDPIIRESNISSNYHLDTVPALDAVLDETDALNDNSTIRSIRDCDSKNNNAATTTTTTTTTTDIARIIEAFVSIKEKVYGIIRQAFSDLVTILKRSATKARDWAVEDDVGQLVSSSLALIGFFACVAAFAVWNIQVLSGGKSKWSGPKNGITVPVVRGLPDVNTMTATIAGGRGDTESPVVVKFQKPKWKAPRIQTSYSNGNANDNNINNIDRAAEDGNIIGNEAPTRR